MIRSAKEQLRGAAQHLMSGIVCSPAPAGWDVALGAVVVGTLYALLARAVPACVWRRLGLVELEH